MDHSAKAAQIRNTATEKIKEVQADRSLSDVGKGQQIRTIREKANSEIAQLRQSRDGELNARAKTLRSQLFTPGHKLAATETEKTIGTMSYRDAIFRAESFASPDIALRMIERARATGDDLLARAIAFVSYERNWPTVLDQYIGADDVSRNALNELRTLEAPKGSAQKFQSNMTFSAIPEAPEERAARVAEHSGSANAA